MILEAEDYRMECSRDRFDLYLLKTINAKDEEKRREEFVLEGYDMTFETCLKVIIYYRLEKKLDITDIKTFLKEYKALKNALL
jgi:hypothetical protein